MKEFQCQIWQHRLGTHSRSSSELQRKSIRTLERRSKQQRRSLRSDALFPVAGDPTGQVSNSHGSVSGDGVVVSEAVPDPFSAGEDNTTWFPFSDAQRVPKRVDRSPRIQQHPARQIEHVLWLQPIHRRWLGVCFSDLQHVKLKTATARTLRLS